MTQAQRPKARILILKEVLEQCTDENNRLSKRAIKKEMEKRGVSISKSALGDSLEVLEDMGYDIDCQLDAKEGNCYCLLSREFEPHEVNILIDAVQSSRFINISKSKELIEKLKKLISKHQAQKMTERIFVEGRVKAQNEQVFYNINEILRALDERLWLRFDYYQYDARKNLETKRGHNIAFPYAIVWEEDCYYLICVLFDMSVDKVTHFRIDRMKQVVSLNEVESSVYPSDGLIYKENKYNNLKAGRQNFNVDDYMKKTFKMFTGEPGSVVLRFHEAILNNMIDRFGSDSPIRPDGDSYYKIHAHIHLSEGFYYWLLQFADKIELLEPEDARQKMSENIRRVSKIYGKDLD